MRPLNRTLIAISVMRAALGALVLVVFDPESQVAIGVCITAFVLAQLSDQLDGWLARTYSTPTVSGYLQDSISDKLFHIGCLLALAPYFEWIGMLLWLVCARELLILAVRVVTNDLKPMLSHFRLQSIGYGLLLRLGLIGFLLGSFFAHGKPDALLVGILYGVLYLAVIVGGINLLFLFKYVPRNVGPRA